MASRTSRSNDFNELICALAGVPAGTDDAKAANVYAGTTGLSVVRALNSKNGSYNLDLPHVLQQLASSAKGTDVNPSIKKLTG